MSDGNFNRALLPSTPYRSGLQMGRAMATKRANEVFKDFVDTHFAHLSTEERESYLTAFQKALME